MRSPHERTLAVMTLVIALAMASARASSAQPAAVGRPSAQEMTRALDEVRRDPNLSTERTIKTLRWKGASDPAPPSIPWWAQWLGGLFGWLEQAGRNLMKLAVAALAATVGVALFRLLQSRAADRPGTLPSPPTHIRSLDIRPESLPADLGGTARALWDAGDHRAALSLLYRGLLSRFVHLHRMPVRDSTTEGDCLALALQHLPEHYGYVSRLVGAWQALVYGGQGVSTAMVHQLCDQFEPSLASRTRLAGSGSAP